MQGLGAEQGCFGTQGQEPLGCRSAKGLSTDGARRETPGMSESGEAKRPTSARLF
ncbi:hypothetical protein PCLA_10r0153 [Pseudomonas citronellolis]|nr:hypothetical protein PCLA_10r0153 [Pseudomonas citronellolis]